MIDGNTLIAWGFKPGRHFKAMLAEANCMLDAAATEQEIWERLQEMVPVEVAMRTNAIPYSVFLDAETDLERANLEAVNAHMDALMRVPTIKAGAIMPDACPAGAAPGTIPVGGVVACEDAIHPGFHSADICCSVAASFLRRNEDASRILDIAEKVTHFGPGMRLINQRRDYPELDRLIGDFAKNRFLDGLEGYAENHFLTQGDGNHFLYVGSHDDLGRTVIVTHHGSRGLGAMLYKRAIAVAQKHTAIVAPRVPKHNAWIKAESEEGRAYWEALQIVRQWTKLNHFAIHDAIARATGNRVDHRFWNEHNFVFRKSDGLFYHGKGATPNWAGFAEDDDGYTLVPLNMAQPILILRHCDNPKTLGFAPHGAGRNMGRKAFMRENDPRPPVGIDARFYCGKPDPSEFPEAYKDANSVRNQIAKYGLGEVHSVIRPLGSMMAGDWEADAPWRKKTK